MKKLTCVVILMMSIGTAAADDKSKPADKTAPADKAAPAEAAPKCRALDVADAKKVLAEAEGKTTGACFSQLYDKVAEHFCVAGTKGKKFDYTAEFDHVIKAGKKEIKALETEKKTFTCHVVSKKK